MRNSKINAAISAALGLGALIAAPTLHAQTIAQCATAETTSSTPKLYMAGSSAAQTGFFSNLATAVFGGFGNMLLFNGTNSTGNSVTNFQAYCGTPVSGNPLGLPTSGIALVYYRAEGGSISGALPIAAGSNPPSNTTGTGVTYQLQQLSINAVSSNSLCGSIAAATSTTPMEVTCSIAGTSSANGATDSFGPTGLQEAYVDIGITDVEPGLLGATVNYPTAYATSVYGSVTAANLSALTTTPAFSQTFGFFINNSTFGGSAPLDFSADTYRNIWAGNYSNWNQVPTSSGALASTSSVPIILINREQGSGSRASANVFLYSAGCSGGPTTGVRKTTSGYTDGWATKEVLVEVGANPGAIGYASIDNTGKVTNASIANLNGLNPNPSASPAGNLLASAGAYPFWYEAKYVQNAAAAGLNGGQGQDGNGTATTVQTAIFTNQALNSPVANVPHWKQIGVIPGSGAVGGVGGIPSSGGNVTGTQSTGANGVSIYTNGFTRSGNSCVRYPGEG